MRSAKFFEPEGGGGRRGDQERRPRGQQPDWFLHDNRDAEPKAAPPRRAGPPAAVRQWEYKDLDGQTHGPFSSEKMRQWSAKGYFQSDLQVRQAGGAGSWSMLSQLMLQMSDRPAPKPQRQPAEDRRVSAFERLASGAGGSDGSQVLQVPRRGGGGREGGRGGGRDCGRGAGRDGALSPRGGGRRGGRDGGRGGRGQRSEEHGGAEEGRQRQRGGRGGRGEGKPRAAAPKMAQAKRLFTNKAALAADQPLWRYVDLSGAVQGPFTAANMTEWYSRGYLGDENLMLIGHDRQVAPPNLPPLKFYRPLGKLLEQGENYVPLTTEDIKCDQAEPAAPAAGDSEQAAAAPAKPLDAEEDGKGATVDAAEDAVVADATFTSPAPAADGEPDARGRNTAADDDQEAAPDAAKADAVKESAAEESVQPTDAAAEQDAAKPAAATAPPDGETVPAADTAGAEAEPAVEPAAASDATKAEAAAAAETVEEAEPAAEPAAAAVAPSAETATGSETAAEENEPAAEPAAAADAGDIETAASPATATREAEPAAKPAAAAESPPAPEAGAQGGSSPTADAVSEPSEAVAEPATKNGSSPAPASEAEPEKEG